MDATFTIRPLTTFAECLQIRELQREIWGLAPKDGIYPPLLLTMSQNGGVVLGAFDASGTMIGFLFGYLARSPGGPLKLYSQAMGVVPTWRNRGVGYALKMEQRRLALEAGLLLITWTFDPLEARNAALNLHKLGGIAHTYTRDLYGSHFGALNEGLPTDRLLVEWWLEQDSAIPVRPLPAKARRVTVTAGNPETLRLIEYDVEASEPLLAIEIPLSIQRIKAADLRLALAWRLGLRTLLETYFQRGYSAIDFVREKDAQERGFYLLELRASGAGGSQLRRYA